MAENEVDKRPEFVNGIRVKMPDDYDFNSWGKNYKEYEKYFTLRTDAVWQKYVLKDWFRLTNKIFFFSSKEKKYLFIEPDDMYSTVLQPWGFQNSQISDWNGFSRTGATSNFQVGIGPKDRVENTFNSFYSMPDYYIMCAMRFQKWFKCDQVHYLDRSTKFDRVPEKGLRNMTIEDAYPCYREFYEASYACADNILKYLIELAYAKRAQDFFVQDASSVQIRSFPIIFDSPTEPERITYTY